MKLVSPFKLMNCLLLFIGIVPSTFSQTYCEPLRGGIDMRVVRIGELFNLNDETWNLRDSTVSSNGYVDNSNLEGIMYKNRMSHIWTNTYKYYGADAPNNYHAVFFMDWNNDGDFDDAGEEIARLDGVPPPYLVNYIVRDSIPIGNYRLRIRSNRRSIEIPDACTELNNIHTVDYTIVVKDWDLPDLPSGTSGNCSDAGFESGTHDAWIKRSGFHDESRRGSCCDDTTVVDLGLNASPLGDDPGNWSSNYSKFTMVDGGIDPITNVIEKVPPWGGNFAFMLGNADVGSRADRIFRTFTVNPDRPNFSFSYALVMNEPGHSTEDQPYFEAALYDANGRLIPCSQYRVTSGIGIPGFEVIPAIDSTQVDVIYKDWERFFVNLSDYIGEDVTVRMTVTDCAQGAHYGYAYIDAQCEPLSQNESNHYICPGESVTLNAPEVTGFEYAWSTGETTAQITVLPTEPINVYKVVLTSYTGCPIDWNDTVFVELCDSICVVPSVFVGNDTTICSNLPFELPNVTVDNYENLIWQHDGSGTLDTSNLLKPIYIPRGNDFGGVVRINLTGTGLLACPDSLHQMTLYVEEEPELFAGSDTVLCGANSYLIADARANQISEISWSHNGNGRFLDSLSRTPSYVATDTDIGNTILMVAVADPKNSCEVISDSIRLTILNGPAIQVEKDSSICITSSYQFYQSSISNSILFTWSHNGSGILSDSSILQPEYVPNDLDIGKRVLFKLVALGNAPCLEVSDSFNLFIGGTPEIDITGIDSICGVNEYQFSSVSTDSTTQLEWFHNGDGLLDDASQYSPVYYPTEQDLNQTISLQVRASKEGNCPVKIDSSSIFFTQSASLFVYEALKVCTGESIALDSVQVSGAESINWRYIGQGSLDTTNQYRPIYQSIEGELEAKLIIEVNAFSPCESQEDTIALEFDPKPLVAVGLDQSVCIGEKAILSIVEKDTFSSVSWSHNGSGFLSDQINEFANYSASYEDGGKEVEVIVTTNSGFECPEISDTILVEVYNNAFVQLDLDREICSSNSTIELQNVVIKNSTEINWSHNGRGTLDTTQLPIIYTIDENDNGGKVQFILEGIGNENCPNSIDTMSVYIAEIPEFETPDSLIFCSTQEIKISPITVDVSNGFYWKHSGEGKLSSIQDLEPIYFPKKTDFNKELVFYLTALGDRPCINVVDSILIFIQEQADLIIPEYAKICRSDSFQISPVVANGFDSLLWEIIGSGELKDTDLTSPLYTPNQINSDTLIQIVAIGNQNAPCQLRSDTLQIEIVPDLIVTALTGTEICAGDSAVINGNAENYRSIQWTADGKGKLKHSNELSIVYQSHLEDLDSIAVLMKVFPNLPCSNEVEDTFLISTIPLPKLTVDDFGTICVNSGYQFKGINALNYDRIEWFHNGNGRLLDSSVLTPFYYPSVSDHQQGEITFTIQITGKGNCLQLEKSVKVRVMIPPVVQTVPIEDICYGASFVLAAKEESTYYTNWTSDGKGALEDSTLLTTIYYPSEEDIGKTIEFEITGYPIKPCIQKSRASKFLRVIAPPKINLPMIQEICAGDTVGIKAVEASNYSQINWELINGKIENESNSLDEEWNYFSDASEGGEELFLIASALPIIPCLLPAIDTMKIVIKTIPEFSIPDRIICPGDSVSLQIVAENKYDNQRFGWSDNASGEPVLFEGNQRLFTDVKDTIKLWVQSLDGCPSKIEAGSIQLHPEPKAEINSTTEIIERLITEIEFENHSTGVSNGIWKFDQTEEKEMKVIENVTHTFDLKPGGNQSHVTTSLWVENEFGCEDETTFIIPIHLKWGVYIPNAFSPANSDTLNAVFYPKGYGLQSIKMWIFNRWGDLIFYSYDGSPWNGKDHIYESGKVLYTSGETVKMDTYVYKVEVLNVFNETHKYIGEVNLIR